MCECNKINKMVNNVVLKQFELKKQSVANR